MVYFSVSLFIVPDILPSTGKYEQTSFNTHDLENKSVGIHENDIFQVPNDLDQVQNTKILRMIELGRDLFLVLLLDFLDPLQDRSGCSTCNRRVLPQRMASSTRSLWR